MIKFFYFASLVPLYFIMSSSVIPQYCDIKQKQYDNFGLVSTFRKYLAIPTEETYISFRSYLKRYFKQSPIDCLKLSERHWNDLVFKVVFWQALTEPYKFIDPSKITPANYHDVLEWIKRKIRKTLLNCSCSDESKFKTELETISQMVKSAERTAFELKSLGNNDKLIGGFDDLIAIWKYLIRNISIDFTNKTIDYYSLFRTLNDISILVKTDSSSNGLSLRLSKRYALLWLYLRYIYLDNEIFDIYHHHKANTIYLIMEFLGRNHSYGINEFYPNKLRLLFEKLYENGSQKLKLILECLRVSNFERDRNWIGASKKISNYFELARSLSESSGKRFPDTTWRIRALAELEAYLIQHGQEVDDYSTKFFPLLVH